MNRPLLLVSSLSLLVASGCRKWEPYEGAFEQPHAIGVLQPENGGPFEEPIGFVGSLHGGQISLLALKQGRFLADDPNVAFLRSNPLATGHQRLLAGVAPVVMGDVIDVFAADRFFETLVRVPYATGVDTFGAPIEPEATFTEATFTGSGTAEMLGLEVKTGFSSTEDWTVAFDGEGWIVTGSVSGRQQEKATTGEPFWAVRRAVAFTIEGSPEIGDTFTFATDNGLTEIDVGGRPMALTASPDGTTLALILDDDGRTSLGLFDPATETTQIIPLAADARPTRVAWSADGTRLYVADASLPIAHEVTVPGGEVTEHRLLWPISDVAPLDDDPGTLLYVTPIGASELWIYDTATSEFRDVNPWLSGVQGHRFPSPVAGIEALPIPYLQAAVDDDGVRFFRRAVAVSLASGRVLFADEGTGCLVSDGLGPRTDVVGQFGSSLVDYTTSYDSLAEQPPLLARNVHNTRHVLPNPCGGVARTQTWLLTYDSLQQGWEVEGSESGTQASLAYEDRRYVSDDGEISFLMRAGGTISQDGWNATFRVVEGLTVADGDTDGDNTTREIILDGPGDPVYFHYTVGGDDQGWRPVDDRPHVLVAGESSDRVGRIMPQEGLIDAAWD